MIGFDGSEKEPEQVAEKSGREIGNDEGQDTGAKQCREIVKILGGAEQITGDDEEQREPEISEHIIQHDRGQTGMSDNNEQNRNASYHVDYFEPRGP
ncbi:hypothetical protein D3C75_819640 [compost metagenome]